MEDFNMKSNIAQVEFARQGDVYYINDPFGTRTTKHQYIIATCGHVLKGFQITSQNYVGSVPTCTLAGTISFIKPDIMYDISLSSVLNGMYVGHYDVNKYPFKLVMALFMINLSPDESDHVIGVYQEYCKRFGDVYKNIPVFTSIDQRTSGIVKCYSCYGEEQMARNALADKKPIGNFTINEVLVSQESSDKNTQAEEIEHNDLEKAETPSDATKKKITRKAKGMDSIEAKEIKPKRAYRRKTVVDPAQKSDDSSAINPDSKSEIVFKDPENKKIARSSNSWNLVRTDFSDLDVINKPWFWTDDQVIRVIDKIGLTGGPYVLSKYSPSGEKELIKLENFVMMQIQKELGLKTGMELHSIIAYARKEYVNRNLKNFKA